MRLLHTTRLEVEEFTSPVPDYAILSHTWEKEEVTLQDLIQHQAARELKGFSKVERSCAVAAKDGFEYLWIDTCCIDKTSSAELSEAINSMFRWYQKLAICYVFLSDVAAGDTSSTATWLQDATDIRWFTRGWTLQELLAPAVLDFYDKGWVRLGSREDFAADLTAITGIPRDILVERGDLLEVPVCLKMQWATARTTTRPDDAAYSLFGLFDVNMPLIYGEGRQKAFQRLQEEILKSSENPSIFLWTLPRELQNDPNQLFCGLLAADPSWFKHLDFPVEVTQALSHGDGPSLMPLQDPVINITNTGIRAKLSVIQIPGDATGAILFVSLACVGDMIAGILIQRTSLERPQYSRVHSNSTYWVKRDGTGPLGPLLHATAERRKSWFPDDDILINQPHEAAFETIYISEYRFPSRGPWLNNTGFFLSAGTGIRSISKTKSKFDIKVVENSPGFRQGASFHEGLNSVLMGQQVLMDRSASNTDWTAHLGSDASQVKQFQGIDKRSNREALGTLKLVFGCYQLVPVLNEWGQQTDVKRNFQTLGSFCVVVGFRTKPTTLLGTPSAFMSPCVGLTWEDDLREAKIRFEYEDLGNTLWYKDKRGMGRGSLMSKKVTMKCRLKRAMRMSRHWYDIDLSWM